MSLCFKTKDINITIINVILSYIFGEILKIPLLVIVAAVVVIVIAVIFGLMPALLPGGPITPTETTPTTTPITTPVTTSTPTTYTTPYTSPSTTPLLEGKYIEMFEEFVDLVHYMKWRLNEFDRSSGELKTTLFYYYNRGIEVIEGVEYMKIEFIIVEESGGNTTIIIWFPKQAGVTPKVIVNGEEVPLYMVEYVAQSFIGLFMNFFVIPNLFIAQIFWPYTPPEIGTVTHTSSVQIMYGNTTLNVDKFVFTPNPNNPDFANITKAEIWISVYKGYNICVYFMMESTTIIMTYELLEMY